MCYLHSAPTQQAVESLIHWIEQDLEKTIVLADGSMLKPDEREVFKLAGFTRLWESNHPFSALEELGPLFSRAIEFEPNHFRWLKDMLNSYSAELPFLSFIKIKQPNHTGWMNSLTWLADVHTDDGIPLLLRYFDTRTLSIIFHPEDPVLLLEQQAAIAADIDTFAWIDRFGDFKTYHPENKAPAVPTFILNEQQQDKLAHGSEIDIVWAHIHRHQPNESTTTAELYTQIQQWLQKAAPENKRNLDTLAQYISGKLSEG